MTFIQCTRVGVFALAGCLLAAGFGQGPYGQEKEPGTDDSVPKLSRVASAHMMIELGRETASPEALLAAAVILHQNPVAELKDKVEDAMAVAPLNPKDLLNEAKAMRPKDKALADYIAKLADDFKEESRGSLSFRGGQYGIASGATARFPIVFKGKASAMIQVGAGAAAFQIQYVNVPSPSPLDPKRTIKREIRVPVQPMFEVTVVDQKGAPVYKGGAQARHVVSFMPAATGSYTLQVKNATKVQVVAGITTN